MSLKVTVAALIFIFSALAAAYFTFYEGAYKYILLGAVIYGSGNYVFLRKTDAWRPKSVRMLQSVNRHCPTGPRVNLRKGVGGTGFLGMVHLAAARYWLKFVNAA